MTDEGRGEPHPLGQLLLGQPTELAVIRDLQSDLAVFFDVDLFHRHLPLSPYVI